MKKDKRKKKGVIYSTNSDFSFEYENEETDTLPNNKQLLKVYIDKHRAGKTVIIIKNFIGTNNALKTLAKLLKIKCGVGGSIKNGEIIIQGDIREKIIEILEKEKYPFKKVGG